MSSVLRFLQPFTFPKNFRLGVASSATQVEGGRLPSNWQDWADRGKIADSSCPSRASDHAVRVDEDLALIKAMGLQDFRIGLSWSRLEPESGHFSAEGFAHYRDVLQRMRELDIAPLVTLHHFEHPLWFERSGAFDQKDAVAIFLRYVQRVVDELGDLIAEYLTINEPNIYVTEAFLTRNWPPGIFSPLKAARVLSQMASAHIQAYQLIHRERSARGLSGTRVGYAHHLQVFIPYSARNPLHRLSTKIADHISHTVICDAFHTGRFRWPLRNVHKLPEGRYYDMIGINYYSRTPVAGFAGKPRSGEPINDLRWPIYPQGIAEVAHRLHNRYSAPIYITENGTCDQDDVFRCRYIAEHLQALVQSELPVERYYQWALTDNWEWALGEVPRFGLIHIDYETQERRMKRSAHFFAELQAARCLTRDLIKRYCQQTYPVQQ